MTHTNELTLIVKPGCHLCEEAEAIVTSVLAEFAAEKPGIPLVLDFKNILDDSELMARYSEEIPVLLINGKVHNYWRIDVDRLRVALHEL